MISMIPLAMLAVASLSGSSASVLGGKRGPPGGILAGAPVNGITVSTENVVQCGQASISWTGAEAPITLQIGIGGYYVGTTWLDILTPSSSSSAAAWTVSQPEGTSLIFQITDNTGQVGYVQNIQVGPGDSDCLSETAATADSASSSASTSATAASTSSTGAYSAPESTGTTAPSGLPEPDSATSSSSTSSSSSSRRKSKFASSSSPATSTTSSASSSAVPTSTDRVAALPVSSAAASSAVVFSSSATSSLSPDPSASLAEANAGQTGGAVRMACTGNLGVVCMALGVLGMVLV